MKTIKYFLICILALVTLAACSDSAKTPVIEGDMNGIPSDASWMKGTWTGTVKNTADDEVSLAVTLKEDGNGFDITDDKGDFNHLKEINPKVIYKVSSCTIDIDYTEPTGDKETYKGAMTLTKTSSTSIDLKCNFTITKEGGDSAEYNLEGTLEKN